jgi:murein DD-endopeptidase MepM/ murein hydrolase activator NlpD
MKYNITTKFILAIITVGILSGCTSRNGPPASVHYDKAISPYHVVKKGDSIASIARKYGMDKRELIRTNGLESPYRIVKGQRLIVRPHKRKKTAREEMDQTEMPATEEVGTVPEEGEVQVKPLAPATGLTGDSMQKGGVPSEGRLNPEVDDEAESMQGDEEQDSKTKHRYDEDNIDEAEATTRRRNIDQPSSLPAAPPAANKFVWPAQGTQKPGGFNPKGKGKLQNDGINILAPKGSPVVAANNGVVAHAGNQLRGFGNVVLVKHDNGTMTVYAHLDKITVKKGDTLAAGQKLGTVGQTGTVKEPQLHFEIRKGRKPIDPNNYLS